MATAQPCPIGFTDYAWRMTRFDAYASSHTLDRKLVHRIQRELRSVAKWFARVGQPASQFCVGQMDRGPCRPFR